MSRLEIILDELKAWLGVAIVIYWQHETNILGNVWWPYMLLAGITLAAIGYGFVLTYCRYLGR